MDVSAELQKIYDSKINVEVSWLCDDGIDVRRGDSLSGYVTETNGSLVDDIIPWLQEPIAHFYPDSTYAIGLATEVSERQRARPSLRQWRARGNVSASRSAKS